jgi:hypothetical protein
LGGQPGGGEPAALAERAIELRREREREAGAVGQRPAGGQRLHGVEDADLEVSRLAHWGGGIEERRFGAHRRHGRGGRPGRPGRSGRLARQQRLRLAARKARALVLDQRLERRVEHLGQGGPIERVKAPRQLHVAHHEPSPRPGGECEARAPPIAQVDPAPDDARSLGAQHLLQCEGVAPRPGRPPGGREALLEEVADDPEIIGGADHRHVEGDGRRRVGSLGERDGERDGGGQRQPEEWAQPADHSSSTRRRRPSGA